MISNDITLLIAEDLDTVFIMIERVLKSYGINNKIIRFENGEKLQNYLQCWFITDHIKNNLLRHILVLDIQMPKMDGIEVLSFMKQENLLQQIPTIMHSATSDDQTRNECFSLGCRDFVVKSSGLKLIESIKEIAVDFDSPSLP
jgi:CheY-like chemotaxis protein